ncbi:hypothetical protein MKEN_01325900 [Mycena kentingensis (nom. inval.)]|nr:hypothetical protein MKEN_01325900 [Mycena kentingensis (nom. inval.)]
MTTTMPAEVVASIASHTTRASLVSLSRVSSLFSSILESLLYRTIDLKCCTQRQLQSFFLAVRRRPHLTTHIRALSFTYPSACVSYKTERELHNVVQRCAKLQVLVIPALESAFFLRVNAFTSLRACEMSQAGLNSLNYGHGQGAGAAAPPLKVLTLHLSGLGGLPNETPYLGRVCGAVLETLSLVMSQPSRYGLSTLLLSVYDSAPNLKHLRICPPHNSVITPNVNGTEPLIFNVLRRFPYLQSLVLHLRSVSDLTFRDTTHGHLPGRTQLAQGQAYVLGKHLCSSLEDHAVPADEQHFGTRIMLVCPNLKWVEIGTQIYAGARAPEPVVADFESEDTVTLATGYVNTNHAAGGWPASYLFTRTAKAGYMMNNIDVKRLRDVNGTDGWRWGPAIEMRVEGG